MNELTHLDKSGEIKMVDVGNKPVQLRIAQAEGFISLESSTLTLIKDAALKKGDVITTAKIAGIQAAKRTADLIPLCHPIITDLISLDINITQTGVQATSMVHCHGRTGAEMEALTAVSMALLTIYDMCKAVDKTMTIGDIHLLKKEKLP